MMRNAGLVLVAACFLIVLQPQNLQAGLFQSDSTEAPTGKGFNLFNFLFGGFGRFRTCNNCLCGRSNRLQFRFQGGVTTEPNEFPWLAAVIVNGSDVYNGALINDRYVLTANSPVNRVSPYLVKVTLGAYDRCLGDLSAVNVSVSNIIPLPFFDPRTGAHDLALLKLAAPVTFNRVISPICMPEPESRYVGQVATITSWGGEGQSNQTRRRRSIYEEEDSYDWNEYEDDEEQDLDVELGGSSSRQKRQANATSIVCTPKKLGLPILGEGLCQDTSGTLQNFQPDSGCAGVIGAQNPICASDAGAPVQFRDMRLIYQLIGVISGSNFCNNTAPAVYTRVNPYVNWIYENTRDACYCSVV